MKSNMFSRIPDNNFAMQLFELKETIPTSFFSQWVIDVSVACSIAGLILSIYVSFSIYVIKSKYSRKGRVPEILNILIQENKKFISILEKFEEEKEEDSYQKHIPLAQIRVIRNHITNINKYLPKVLVKLQDELAKLYESFSQENHAKEAALEKLWEFQPVIIEIITRTESSLNDEAWE